MKQEEMNETWVVDLIRDYIDTSPHNTLGRASGDRAWGEPLIGFSRGDDPLYDEFKRHIGSFHFTPLELFSLTFPDRAVSADELTVISWVLPHTAQTKEDNRRESKLPSERWARARTFGEEVNQKLREHVLAELQKQGFQGLSPALSAFKRSARSPLYGRASIWSERHAAFASGLGTFGLCDGLITPVGKAVRCGSIIARIDIAPTERPYQDHHAYCLHYSGINCQKCIERCPVEAISATSGHDKEKCGNYLDSVTEAYIQSRFGFGGHGCGLCQTGVPCESRIPVPDDWRE